jgi:hypothetical protein
MKILLLRKKSNEFAVSGPNRWLSGKKRPVTGGG